MHEHDPHPDAEQLFRAVEAVIAVLSDAAARSGGRVILDEVTRIPDLHVRLGHFPLSDIEEATRFLIRMGILEVVDATPD